MKTAEAQSRIRSFLEDELLVEFDDVVTPDTDLFKAGVIESRNYLNILRFLREDLMVELTDEDLFMNVLVSLSGMTAFVVGKTAR